MMLSSWIKKKEEINDNEVEQKEEEEQTSLLIQSDSENKIEHNLKETIIETDLSLIIDIEN